MSMHIVASNPLIQSVQAEALGTPTKEIKGRPNPAFQPETTVSLEGSVKTTLQALDQAIHKQSAAAKALPAEIQKLISHIMKNSFSLEQSVSQGLTSALQGQRASMEQLNVLGKILQRLGMSMQNQGKFELSENLWTLLSSIKLSGGSNSQILNTTMLHKAFMQLMDGRPLQDMPKELQFLLQGKTNGQTIAAPNGSLAALQQLMKQLLPSLPMPPSFSMMQTAAGKGSGLAADGAANSQSSGFAQTAPSSDLGASQQAQSGAENAAASAETLKTAVKDMAAGSDAVAMKQEGQQQAGGGVPFREGEGMPKAQNSSTEPPLFAEKTVAAKMSGSAAAVLAEKAAGNASQSGNMTASEITQTLKAALDGMKGRPEQLKTASHLFSALSANLQMAAAKSQNPNAALLRALLTTRPLQNTPELMHEFKMLARQLLIENGTVLTDQNRQALQKIGIGQQQVLADADAKALQEMVRVIQQNLPYAVKNVAVKHQMPEAVKVWTMAQLGELIELQTLNEREIMRAGKSVNDFMTLLKTSATTDAQTQGTEKSMVMMMPMYLGENETVYPSYIHIFHQQNEDARGQIEKKETWFRVCMLTENVGAVELVFRMYGRRMDMRLAFSDEETAIYFPYYMQNIREAFRELKIQLADVKINVIGDPDEL